MDLHATLRESLLGLLRELVDGPAGDAAFIVNPGDRGLVRSLAQLSAAQASARRDGRSSVAAHVQHLRYSFELLNRWMRGENPFAEATYAKSWGMQQVSDQEWTDLVTALERETRAWMEAVAAHDTWDETTLSGAISSIAHLAYHMGAVRQLVPSAAGPPAAD